MFVKNSLRNPPIAKLPENELHNDLPLGACAGLLISANQVFPGGLPLTVACSPPENLGAEVREKEEPGRTSVFGGTKSQSEPADCNARNRSQSAGIETPKILKSSVLNRAQLEAVILHNRVAEKLFAGLIHL